MFPALKSKQLLAVLGRKPLCYVIVRQVGSHRRLESSTGYPPLTFAYHDGKTIAPGAVKHILIKAVGLTEQEALNLL